MNASWWPVLWHGLLVTIEMVAICTVLTIPLALIAALGRISTHRWARTISATYVELMRGVPLLVLLVLVYFGAGSFLARSHISALVVAIVIITVNEAAYLAEVYRGAIASVSPGQWDAAASMGMTRTQALRLVVVPQAVTAAMPSTINEVIYLLKGSAMASIITVNELTNSGQSIVSMSFEPLQVYLWVGALYLAVAVPLTYAGRLVEHQVSRKLGAVAQDTGRARRPRMRMGTLAHG
jgi:His/Glu/Gln/Arg/opine family amino acid ABC transporter permease subunit